MQCSRPRPCSSRLASNQPLSPGARSAPCACGIAPSHTHAFRRHVGNPHLSRVSDLKLGKRAPDVEKPCRQNRALVREFSARNEQPFALLAYRLPNPAALGILDDLLHSIMVTPQTE